MTDLTLTIPGDRALDRTAITDALNETLRALAISGALDDHDDQGWRYEGQIGRATHHREGELAETFPVVYGLPLRLSFTPDAIREHWSDDPSDEIAQFVLHADDAELARIGALALQSEALYRAFHTALKHAVMLETAAVEGNTE